MTLRLVSLVLTLALVGCGEDAASEDEGCACSDAVCGEARCTLRVINECPESWGEAKVFVNDDGGYTNPTGVSADGAPFESCEGFSVGETFRFLVQSEDNRTISETRDATFQCEANQPFEFRLGCGR